MLTTLFMVNIVGHVLHQGSDTKNTGDVIMDAQTIYSNPRHLTSEVNIVGYSIKLNEN